MREKQGISISLGAGKTECPNCGAIDVSTKSEPEQFMYGKGEAAVELTVSLPVHTCQNCGFQFTDANADNAKHEAICRHLGVHAPKEIVALRTRYALTRAEFAQITRIGEASIQRWETGQLIQNPGYDQLLFLLNYPANLDRLRERAAGCSEILTGPPTELRRKFPNLADIGETRRQARGFRLCPTGS